MHYSISVLCDFFVGWSNIHITSISVSLTILILTLHQLCILYMLVKGLTFTFLQERMNMIWWKR